MLQRLLPVLTFSSIALFLFFTPVGQVRADAGATHTHVIVDGYSAELVLPNGPAQVGPNPVIIRLLNIDHQPVPNATVLLAASAMTTTDAGGHSHSSGGHNDSHADGHTHSPGEAHIDIVLTQMVPGVEAGTYTSVIHFDSAGAWQVRLQFNDARTDHAALFAVTVAEPARDWRILSAFGGANALIIVTAGVMKQRFCARAKRKRAVMASNSEA
jgi:hypothetical protein